MLSDIQNTALSGLEAFVVSERQCSLLDSAVVKTCRVAMQGGAVRRGPDGTVIGNMSNRDILRHWRIATCSTELTTMRF